VVVGQFEILRARSLAPLVKARGFGMTCFKTRAKLTHYRKCLSCSLVGRIGLTTLPQGHKDRTIAPPEAIPATHWPQQKQRQDIFFDDAPAP
jgi:hypothetical protein